jgi:hypothetical protein
MTAKRSATSCAVRAIGPIVSKLGLTGMAPWLGTRPMVGRSPVIPFKAAGTRTEPPVSVPSAASAIPVATAMPEPPEDPPGILSGSQGLWLWPITELWQRAPNANSWSVALPTTTAPALRSRSTTGASAFGMFPSKNAEP